MGHELAYVMDTHIVTAGEQAYAHLMKVWIPSKASPQMLNNALPLSNTREEWLVHHAELSVFHSDGFPIYGCNAAIIDVGPPGTGAMIMAADFMGSLRNICTRKPERCSWGIGWAIWPCLVAGDIVVFRCKYEVIR
jgi:hypothetical protein